MGIKFGSNVYRQHVEEEIKHYSEMFADDVRKPGEREFFQPVPPAWIEVETRAAALIERKVGHNCLNYLNAALNREGQTVNMLSLGTGPCGIELSLASVNKRSRIMCVDLNQNLLDIAASKAREQNLAMDFQQGDLNDMDLPAGQFDVVFCHASLHHVLELERLMAQIRKTLRPGGQLVLVDVVTQNGYLMWPETSKIVNQVFASLPEELRINRTIYSKPRTDKEVWDVDQRQHGMECIRSQDILPLLRSNFTEQHYVPYFSMSRRFFDCVYGSNYDLTNPLHRAAFDWIWELDCHYIETGKLRPETVFGVYRLK